MQYTTATKQFNKYPIEFSDLSQEQEQEARAEFNRVEAIQREIKNELKMKITNQ